MMLPPQDIAEIKKELDSTTNPIYFFDDDPDGLSSFLLLYRYVREGHGIVVKTHPRLVPEFAEKVKEYHADKVFILDVALVDQEFLNKVKSPTIWIDHHGPYERKNVRYFNPRLYQKDANIPTTYLCYQVVKQDMWIAMTGCIADYYLPDFLEEAQEKYPDILENYKTIPELYFKSKLGVLIKAFSFCLKGKTVDILKNIKILTRIQSPYEILNQETSQGKFIYRRYSKLNTAYQYLVDQASGQATDSNILTYIYEDDQMSFTGDLSNELLFKFPGKLILVGRKKDDEVRMSLRSKNLMIPPILDKALAGLEGFGGGHEHACGANVKQHQFEEFLKRIKTMI